MPGYREDKAKAQELWNEVVAAWFPDSPDTPGLVLLRVDLESAQFWDAPGEPDATAFK